MTQYHQVPTATAFYWPSTIIWKPVPLHTDPNLYCCLGITDFCTVYPGSCSWQLLSQILEMVKFLFCKSLLVFLSKYQHRKCEVIIPTHVLYSWQIMPMTYKIPQWLLGYNVQSAIVIHIMTPSFPFLSAAIPLPKALFCTTRKRVLMQ